MAQKISKTQFENWSEQIKKLELGSLKMVPEGPEKDKAFDFISTVIFEIKKGNTLALLIEALGVFQTNFTLNNLHVKSSVLDNLTAEEWTNDIIKQIEEHHKQRRNYSVNVNDILTRLKQQEEISKDKSRLDQIMSFLWQEDPEGHEMVWKFRQFWKKLKQLERNNGVSGHESKENFKKIVETSPYLFEDLVKTVEEGEKLVNLSSRSTGNSSSTPSPSPQNSAKLNNRIGQLEVELEQTQQKVGKLETNSTGDEDKLKKQELEKKLTALKQELEDLRRCRELFSQNSQNQSKNNNSNSNKLNWAIGLGVAAVVISVIGIILLLAMQKKKKKVQPLLLIIEVNPLNY